MAHIVKNVLATTSLSRLIGAVIMVSALLGALVSGASVAAAQESDDSRSTDSGVQPFESFEDAEDNRADREADSDTASEPENARSDGDDADVRTPDEGNDSGNGQDGQDSADDAQETEPDESGSVAGTIDVESILTSVAAGQSLADYAALYGISEEDLVAALIAEIDTKLTLAVENGYLTQEQADEIMASAESHLAALINLDNDVDHEDVSIEQFLSAEVFAELIGTHPQVVEVALQRNLSLAEIAAWHGMTEEELIAALVTEIESKVADAVANGDLSSEQADEILMNLEAKLAELVGAEDETGQEAVPDVPGLDTLATVAELTGTTTEDVMAAIQSGQTLVEFAAEHGVDEDTLVSAIVADVEVQVTAAVDNGFLTQDEADMILANAGEFVTTLVNAPNPDDVVDSASDECEPIVPNGSNGEQSVVPDLVCPETN